MAEHVETAMDGGDVRRRCLVGCAVGREEWRRGARIAMGGGGMAFVVGLGQEDVGGLEMRRCMVRSDGLEDYDGLFVESGWVEGEREMTNLLELILM